MRYHCATSAWVTTLPRRHRVVGEARCPRRGREEPEVTRTHGGQRTRCLATLADMRQDENTAILSRSFGEVADEYNRLRSGPSAEALDWLLPSGATDVIETRSRDGSPHVPAGRSGRPRDRGGTRRPHAGRPGRRRPGRRGAGRSSRGDPGTGVVRRRGRRPVGLALGRRVACHSRGRQGAAPRRPAGARLDADRTARSTGCGHCGPAASSSARKRRTTWTASGGDATSSASTPVGTAPSSSRRPRCFGGPGR